MSEEKKTDYKQTLNLPQTSFSMKANLAQREPQILSRWKEMGLYEKQSKDQNKKESYILHDGPPYANGNIHFGHILNKILKDIIVKSKNMSGYRAEYIPGWDCHGLPIEHQVVKKIKKSKQDLDVLELRQACRNYAQSFVDSQREEFKRLGILGDWEHPYITMDKTYEATIARKMAELTERGQIYKGAKPIHWCTNCQTALAEAEVEHEDHQSPSIYVKFAVTDGLDKFNLDLDGKKGNLVIWTTTPWTLPANQAVAVHETYNYVFAELNDEIIILAEDLFESFQENTKNPALKVINTVRGNKLTQLTLQHPFLDRHVPVILANFVTLDAGVGCVHIAPGHGQDDYEAGIQNNLEILNPVDDKGVYTEKVGLEELVGQFVFKANPLVIEILKKNHQLIFDEVLEHSYPHCWRCKNPVIFRSTPQYFVSMDKNDLRGKALDQIRRVNWIPDWGRDRIYGMVESRSDWCISRQRYWGNPLMTFSCKACEKSLIDSKVMFHIAELFEEEGADLWFKKSAQDLIPQGTLCECGSSEFTKESDILDVWFDSGVSYAAVLETRPTLSFPADLYLEGSDQHRGWFHSSLLTAAGTKDQAPYKNVLTHGFVVDGAGKKYSKSAKNYTPPEQLINKIGADVMRLWVAGEDYRQDIRFSNEIIDRIVESYRKYRNTVRYLLGNLYDFDYDRDWIKENDRLELDRWTLGRLQEFIQNARNAYDSFNFHTLYHQLNNFCINILSSYYLDILKDRLYVSGATSFERKSAQSTLYDILDALVRITAPILSFTAEDIYENFNKKDKCESVLLETLPVAKAELKNLELDQKYQTIGIYRSEVLKALEIARQAKIIGHSLEAQVKITALDDHLKTLQKYESELNQIFIVSQVVVTYEIQNENIYQSSNIPGLAIEILQAEGEKCNRCWIRSTTVGKDETHKDLCSRCVKAI